MTALDILTNITSSYALSKQPFKFCLVDDNKRPYKLNGELARPNKPEDFVDLATLVDNSHVLQQYRGLGISIQASNICAIDVDDCFSREFDITSADSRAIDIITMFCGLAYIEFSFSGKGLRIFFNHKTIENYEFTYYTKAEEYSIEFYQPANSARYVTITGRTIADCHESSSDKLSEMIHTFLNKYMKRKIVFNRHQSEETDTRTFGQLLAKTKQLYLRNFTFQELWFDENHFLDSNGQSQESNRDYQLMVLLYENVTRDREKLRLIFEASPYFKTKDDKHIRKWTYQDYRYYNYQFDKISGRR